MKIKFSVILGILFLVTGCGQSGSLYLPQNPQKHESNQQMNQTLQQQGDQDGAD